MSAAVKTTNRERMADDLEALGLYATSNDVRRGRSPLTKGVAHVSDYCLPKLVAQITGQKQHNAKRPPIPGTFGAAMVPRMEARRDRLQAFVDDWWIYDIGRLAVAPQHSKEGS